MLFLLCVFGLIALTVLDCLLMALGCVMVYRAWQDLSSFFKPYRPSGRLEKRK